MDFISDLVKSKTPSFNKTPSYLNYINILPNSNINIPTKFNQNDSSTLIKVYDSGSVIKYVGPGIFHSLDSSFIIVIIFPFLFLISLGHDDNDAAAIRTDNPIPPSIGFFYYEVTIINKGEEGFISVGIAQSNTILNRLTGISLYSYQPH